jgi:putative inorganic carbon (hco3(-)) transporter
MISFVLYILFIVSYFLHLPTRFPWLGVIRFDMLLVGLILVTSFIERKKEANHQDHSTKYLLAIFIFIFMSLPFVMWPGSVLRANLWDYLKVVIFYFFTVSIIRNEGRLKILIFVFLACAIFRFLEPAYLHATTRYWGGTATAIFEGKLEALRRLSGAPSDVINANQLAWVVVSTIPFLYYLGWRGKPYLKILSAAVAPIAVFVLIKTGSRTGMVTLIITVITMLFYGEKKFKRVAIGLMILIPVAYFIAENMHPLLQTRFRSTFESGLPGSDTAAGRIRGLERGISTLGTRILIGHGLGTSSETNANLSSGRGQRSHNLYLETVQEIGLIGLFLFLLFVRGIYRNLSDAKSILRDTLPGNHWLMALAKAIHVWIIMDLFYSIACFGLNSWEWYFFGGISVAVLRAARQKENLKATAEIRQQKQVLIPATP